MYSLLHTDCSIDVMKFECLSVHAQFKKCVYSDFYFLAECVWSNMSGTACECLHLILKAVTVVLNVTDRSAVVPVWLIAACNLYFCRTLRKVDGQLLSFLQPYINIIFCNFHFSSVWFPKKTRQKLHNDQINSGTAKRVYRFLKMLNTDWCR